MPSPKPSLADFQVMPLAIVPEKFGDYVIFHRSTHVPILTGEQVRIGETYVPPVTIPGAMVRDVGGLPIQQLGRVAVVPMAGMVVKKPTYASRYGWCCSTEQFAAVNEELAADPGVSAIVWDCDSPGGSVAGVQEAADRLFALRGTKPIVAVANSMMASGAYWLGSCADKIVATPSSLMGSIGVVYAHQDHSKANEQDGVKVTYVYSGKYKTDGNFDEPLSESARAAMQSRSDEYYAKFVDAVARNRKASAKAVRDGYGQGSVLTAERAVEAGLANSVGTMTEVLKKLGAPAGDTQKSSSAYAVARQRHAEAMA